MLGSLHASLVAGLRFARASLGELLLIGLATAHINRVLVERVAAVVDLLVLEVIVLMVLRVKVILCPAVEGSRVAICRDDRVMVVLRHSACPEAVPDLQLRL